MAQNSPESGDWFLPKRYGYGSSLPIRWQGWVLMLGYMALVITLALMATRVQGSSAALVITGMIALTLAFVRIVARRTRGGWRWRWGEPD